MDVELIKLLLYNKNGLIQWGDLNLNININKEIGKPIYIQIFEQIRDQILSGVLAPGYRLPPERKLAESLDVNRTTVLNAYRELKSEGLVGSHVGQGTVVLSHLTDVSPKETGDRESPAWNQMFSQYSNGLGQVLVGSLLALASRDDVISFATGIASPESGPIEIFSGIEAGISADARHKALQHSPTEGFFSLREAICTLVQKRGIYCSTDEVITLSGSQQGIDIAARVFLDPGDIVVVEEPSFFPAIQVFRALGARVIGIPADGRGMRVDMLEQLLLRYRPKLVYTIPSFQNPSNIEMELERRKKLVELSHKFKFIILEDDAYAGLCYEGQQLPALRSMDSDGYVIYLSTFSKSVYAGLRLGFIVAQKQVVKQFSAAKQVMDLHSNSVSQWVVERFIVEGKLDSHVARLCSEYRKKRDIMHEALSMRCIRGMEWNRPKGGYYFWLKLPQGVSASRLVTAAAAKKVVFVPGKPFFTNGQGDDYIRLNFTFASQKDIKEGIGRLCEAIAELLDGHREMDISQEFEIKPIV